jgi:hypothetical protein
LKLTSSKFILVFVWLLFMASSGCAQGVLASINAFNEVTGSAYSVSNKRKILIIEGFREGQQVKVDKVDVFDLDMKTLKYSQKDQSVSIKCYSELEGCVTSKLVRERNKKSYRNRVVFGLTENVVGEEVLSELRQLLTQMIKTY